MNSIELDDAEILVNGVSRQRLREAWNATFGVLPASRSKQYVLRITRTPDESAAIEADKKDEWTLRRPPEDRVSVLVAMLTEYNHALGLVRDVVVTLDDKVILYTNQRKILP